MDLLDTKTFIEKGFLPLISTFIGAFLAFSTQRYRDKNALHDQRRNLIIGAYHANLVNLQTLLSFKNMFLMGFDERFSSLRKFCSEFANPRPDSQRGIYEQGWRGQYRNLFKEIATGDVDQGPILLKQRWERPIFLAIQEKDLSFIAMHSPSILSVIAFIKSTEDLIETELNHREAIVNEMPQFIENPEAIHQGSENFIRKLFLLLTVVDGIMGGIDRALALSFGLSCMLERHYLVRYGQPKFPTANFSKENLALLPDLKTYANFLGTDDNLYVIQMRLKYAENRIAGHRELNYPTSILASKI